MNMQSKIHCHIMTEKSQIRKINKDVKFQGEKDPFRGK